MERPASYDAGPDQHQDERDEQDAVNAAGNANGKGHSREVLQWHCHEKQDEEGYALSERDETKPAQRNQALIALRSDCAPGGMGTTRVATASDATAAARV